MEKKQRALPIKATLYGRRGQGVRFTNLLPYKDMVEIMSRMLQQPHNELKQYTSDNSPSFVRCCAKWLVDGDLDRFSETLEKCERMAEQKQMLS